VLFMLNYLNLV